MMVSRAGLGLNSAGKAAAMEGHAQSTICPWVAEVSAKDDRSGGEQRALGGCRTGEEFQPLWANRSYPEDPMSCFCTGRADPEGRALVLIHGAGGDHKLWEEVHKRLRSSGVPVLALDLPGHGQSAGPGCRSVETGSDAVEETLATAGACRYAVAGHSLGGAIALTLAARRSPGLAGIAAISTGARLYVDPMILKGTLQNFARTVENVARHCFPRGTAEAAWRRAAEVMATTGRAVVHADFAACAGYGLQEAKLADIRVPVEVVCGEVDIMTPMPLSEELAAAIPDAQLTRIPGCGHMPLLEDPGALAAVLVRLWGRSFGGGGP